MPGLSVIRAVVRKGMIEGYVVTDQNGWLGLVENDMRILDVRLTSGYWTRGTILGTSRINPLENPEQIKQITENYKRSGIDAVIAVGGEETLRLPSRCMKKPYPLWVF